MNVTDTKTLELLKAALAPTEEILRAEYVRQLTARCDKLLAELAADGWDARKHHDYPEGTLSRINYRIQLGRYTLCNEYTKSVKHSLSMHDPDIRVAKADNAERIAKLAAEMARTALEGFCYKLAGKIDATRIVASKVDYVGGTNAWGRSLIRVNGGEQSWQTQMIVNISCLGKLFNQWPTRLVARNG